MRALYRLLVCFCFILPAGVWAGPYTNIFVLGDSLSDSGNVLRASPSLPFFGGNAVPGAPYFQGRASNGPVAVEVLAQRLGLALTASENGGNNYAYGGARTNTHLFELIFPGANVDFDLLAQLDKLTAATPVLDPNALYVVFGGSNNLQDAIRAAALDPANAAAIAQGAIANAVGDLGEVIGTMTSLGARNFLVPNAPNIALVPRIIEQNDRQVSQFATQVTRGFNSELEGLLARFNNPNMIGFDLFGLLQQVVADPTAFGLTDLTGRCYTGDDITFTGGGSVCGNPDEFLFWDGIHPTASVHRTLGDALYAAVAVPEPGVLALFAIGFAAVRRHRRC